MTRTLLDKALDLLDEIGEDNGELFETARVAHHNQTQKFSKMGASEVKALYEEWEPKRKDTLAQLPDGSERGVKARVFYHFLDNAYDKHRSEIRRMLAAEREAGAVAPSARVALERHEQEEAGAADGAGGWVGKVLHYLYDEQEKPQ